MQVAVIRSTDQRVELCKYVLYVAAMVIKIHK